MTRGPCFEPCFAVIKQQASIDKGTLQVAASLHACPADTAALLHSAPAPAKSKHKALPLAAVDITTAEGLTLLAYARMLC
jgi:hypothetical protein